MMEGIKNLPPGSIYGARAAERSIARRRTERATAGPNEQRTPFQEMLDRTIDERDAATTNVPQSSPPPLSQEMNKLIILEASENIEAPKNTTTTTEPNIKE